MKFKDFIQEYSLAIANMDGFFDYILDSLRNLPIDNLPHANRDVKALCIQMESGMNKITNEWGDIRKRVIMAVIAQRERQGMNPTPAKINIVESRGNFQCCIRSASEVLKNKLKDLESPLEIDKEEISLLFEATRDRSNGQGLRFKAVQERFIPKVTDLQIDVCVVTGYLVQLAELEGEYI